MTINTDEKCRNCGARLGQHRGNDGKCPAAETKFAFPVLKEGHMYEYKTFDTIGEAVADMDDKKWTHVVVSAWFNSIDGLIYVTYKRIP